MVLACSSEAAKEDHAEEAPGKPEPAATLRSESHVQSCTDSSQCEGKSICFTEEVDTPPGEPVTGMCSVGTSLWGRTIKEVKDGQVEDGPPLTVM